MSLRDLLPPGTFDEISKELENKNRAAVRTDVCPVCKRTQITATDFNGAVVLKLLSADCIKEYTQTDF